MEKFTFGKSKEANILKSIRFPENINDRILEIIETSKVNHPDKEYSFNGFIVSACEFALAHFDDESL